MVINRKMKQGLEIKGGNQLTAIVEAFSPPYPTWLQVVGSSLVFG
jgi:hypothetical protein